MPAVRLTTKSSFPESMQLYDAMRSNGQIRRAVVIAELRDGSYHVLGQGMSLGNIAAALVIAADALQHQSSREKEIRLEPHIPVVKPGVPSGMMPLAKAITLNEAGEMVPPPGEGFMSCGECQHPRWFALHQGGELVRLACTHCGNEVRNQPHTHDDGGRA